MHKLMILDKTQIGDTQQNQKHQKYFFTFGNIYGILATINSTRTNILEYNTKENPNLAHTIPR